MLSVVICTYNRATLLDKVLDSLCKQTLPAHDFEVLIINDGSVDDTQVVAAFYAAKLPLRYAYQRNAGLASAKNHGLFACRGDVVLFLDDDDIATETLLEEHVKTHAEFPAEHFAVLGYTALSPDISGDPLMHFVTEIGCFLFSYPSLRHGDALDYTYFWGGRSSCKRSLLLEFGVFNPVFRFGAEDIELGYRLSRLGLQVIYNKNAVSYTIRKIDFDAFCHRLERQGASSYVCSQIHAAPEIQQWAGTADSEQSWATIGGHFEAIIKSARCLDSMANLKLATGLGLDEETRNLLYRGYWAAFKACKIKGIQGKKESLNKPMEALVGQEKTVDAI
ncbi:Glycosyl transferase family 2 [Nitrosospira sp. Nsp11]|uniref:glycosyltransferase n=1 Tax=Nitrosospira sp. Nsp11 TaxID=1855338 RepID=UPI000918F316|nr:glycosyltransferase [Nitrosospira sp. Nsp11]SHL97233.1 Glycosyl transferase family 2 [Nitrosospira sp. Nsp11]